MSWPFVRFALLFGGFAWFCRGMWENAIEWNQSFPNNPMDTWEPLALMYACIALTGLCLVLATYYARRSERRGK